MFWGSKCRALHREFRTEQNKWKWCPKLRLRISTVNRLCHQKLGRESKAQVEQVVVSQKQRVISAWASWGFWSNTQIRRSYRPRHQRTTSQCLRSASLAQPISAPASFLSSISSNPGKIVLSPLSQLINAERHYILFPFWMVSAQRMVPIRQRGSYQIWCNDSSRACCSLPR